jgi:4-aminobutyrate aminotransferase-like enzyme
LLEDVIECSGCQVVTRFARHGDDAAFHGMIELAMTTTGSDVFPTISFDDLNKVANLHSNQLYVLPRTTEINSEVRELAGARYAKSRSSNRISASSIATAEYSTQYSAAQAR